MYRLTRAFDYTIATNRSCLSNRSGRSGWQSIVCRSICWLAQDGEIPISVVEELPGLPGPIPRTCIPFGHYTKGSGRTDPGPTPDRTRPESRQHVLRVRRPSRARPHGQVLVLSKRGSGPGTARTATRRPGAGVSRTSHGTSYGGKRMTITGSPPGGVARLALVAGLEAPCRLYAVPPGQQMGDRFTSLSTGAPGRPNAERWRL